MLDTEDCLFNFEISSHCNAKCPSCFRTEFNEYVPKPYKHLKADDFEDIVYKNISWFRNHSYSKIQARFCGEIGDPLMNPELDRLTFIAENAFDSVEIFTNGGLRNPRWIKEFLIKHKTTNLVFGIDGLTDETNQMYRVSVNTDLAFRNMKEAVKHGHTRWDYTIFSHNYHEVSDVIKLGKELEVDLLCRFNGRQYNKLDDEYYEHCENLLKTNEIKYYICK